MIARAKRSWQRFAASEPGHRFQDRYRHRQQSEQGWKDPWRLFYVLGGLIVALGSLAFGVLPGPGTLTFFVGVGMIAGEFRPVARLLDWAEVRVREFGWWVGGLWRSSGAGKAMVVSVSVFCVGAVLWVAYLLLFAG
jgi:hypothetical protein